MDTSKPLNKNVRYWDAASIFAVIFATLLGLYVRISPVLSADFPLNDGGLFYVMARDLVQSGFHLPDFTSYNGAQIPFTYPPLSFYFAATISSLSGISLLEIIRFLPAVFSVLTIPAIYLLSREILGSKAQAALAVFAFSMLPRSFEWFIMGGGLTRSPGFLFAILAVLFGLRAYKQNRFKSGVYSAFFIGLTLLTHPEMSLFMIYSLALLFLFYNKTWKGFGLSFMMAAGAGLLTSPWWVPLLFTHGLGPLASALQSGHRVWFMPGQLIMLDYSAETFLSLIGITSLFGLLVCFVDKKVFLPTWSLAIALVSTRSSGTLMALPLALLAGLGIDQVIIPGIKTLGEGPVVSLLKKPSDGWVEDLLQNSAVRAALAFFILYTLLSARLYPLLDGTALQHLPEGEQIAMDWAAEHTSDNSRYLVISALQGFWADQTSEWFPALTNRESVVTVQGYEWVPGAFYKRWVQNSIVQSCGVGEVRCLDEWALNNDITFNYIYLSRRIAPDSNRSVEPLLVSLRRSPGYTLVYENPEAAIFKNVTQIGAQIEDDKQ